MFKSNSSSFSLKCFTVGSIRQFSLYSNTAERVMLLLRSLLAVSPPNGLSSFLDLLLFFLSFFALAGFRPFLSLFFSYSALNNSAFWLEITKSLYPSINLSESKLLSELSELVQESSDSESIPNYYSFSIGCSVT